MGFPYPTRMSVVRLSDGASWVWSPVALTEELARAVEAIGPVRHIVSPNKIHHLFLAEWAEKFPDASIYAPPGLLKRLPDLHFDAELHDEHDRDWAGDIDQVIFRGSLFMEEVVFFHKASRTAIVCDLIQRHPEKTMTGWRGKLMRLDSLVGDQPVEWEPLVTIGKPADEIARVVEEKNIDLVITATRGRSGFKRLILGSITERLMRTLACPLLVVCSPGPAAGEVPQRPMRLDRILVGCDFSADSDQAFEHGLSLAQEYEAELHLAHVIEPPVQPNLIHVETVIPGEIQEDHRNLLIQKLKNMVPAEAANWCTPQITIMEGQPYDELVKYADTRDIDMIVLGVRGHGLVKTLFLGSTTDRVIRHSSCPVLSVSSRVQSD